MSVGDLNSAFTLLGDLGHEDLAQNLLNRYVAAHRHLPRAFDLANHPFGGSVSNQHVRDVFDAMAKPLPLPTFGDAVSRARDGAYDAEVGDRAKPGAN